MFNNPYNVFPFNTSQGIGMMNGLNQARMASNLGGNIIAKPSIFKSLTSIKWGNVLTNTQKTLNVINQAIPVYYQIHQLDRRYCNLYLHQVP